MTDTQYLDGWRIDVGPDAVSATSRYGGDLVLFASGRILSGGCDVPGNVVQVMRAELAKLREAPAMQTATERRFKH